MRGLGFFSITLLALLVLVRGSVAPQAQPFTSEQWEGFYLGTHVGAVDSSTGIRDLDGTLFDIDAGTLFTNDLNVTGGVHAGYNFQSGNRVFGVEADYSWTDAGRARIFDGIDHFASSQIDGFGSIRGRAGLAVDNALIYFTGGVGLIDLNLYGNDDPATQAVSYEDQIVAVVGAGAEAKLGSNLSARLEYLHYFGGTERDLCPGCDDPAHGSAALQVVRVGVTYHIGDSPEPAAPNGNDPWSGFYLGVHAGAADTSTGLQDESTDIFPGEEGTVFTGDISAAGGVHVGYNHLIRSLLLGIEADYSWTDAGSARNFGGTTTRSISSKIDGFGSLRGRLGVASGNAAAYITGGVGFVDAVLRGANSGNNNAASIKDHFALVAGAGTEAKISSNLSTRLEYLYYGFDEKRDTCAACGGQPALADGSIHYLRVGLTYHLNDTATDEDDGKAGNWAGFYGGAHAGVAHSKTGIRDDDARPFGGDPGATVITPLTDPAGGVYAGYNFQWGNAVFGLEGDYTFVNAKKGGIFDNGFSFRESDIRGYGSVRGRLGLAAGDAMFYTTGGIGFIDATLSGGDPADPARVVKFKNFLALVAGGGVALKLTDNIAFRTEYLYYGFDEKSDTCLICTRGPAFGGGVIHTARAGLTFLLN